MGGLTVGLTATRGKWSADLRAFVRDHAQGIALEVIMDKPALMRAAARIDILVVDDLMRLFSADDLSRVIALGVHVIGIREIDGMGDGYLATLGVEKVVDADSSPEDTVALLKQVEPRRHSNRTTADWGSWPDSAAASKRGRATISVWHKVSGGAGMTEAIIAAAEFSAQTSKTILVELDHIVPIMVSRLLRSPDAGLACGLSRVANGQRVVPDALNGAREDGVPPVGSFDVICAGYGQAPKITAGGVSRLVDDIATSYDHIYLETSSVPTTPGESERSAAVRTVLSKAHEAVLFASSDPHGAARLVEWKATMGATVAVPCQAVFGRASESRYEKDHLASLVASGTHQSPFSRVVFLPEDAVVQRARWNAELVWKGPWLREVRSLALIPSVRGSTEPKAWEGTGGTTSVTTPSSWRTTW